MDPSLWPASTRLQVSSEKHLRDDGRNSLVRQSTRFAVALAADIVVMENARELIRGNFKHHDKWFREHLESHGYNVFGRTYLLSRFGLPQDRERAIVITAKQCLPLHTLDSLWDGWSIRDEALTVRQTFGAITSDHVGFDHYPPDFTLKLDRSDAKIMIAKINKDQCIVRRDPAAIDLPPAATATTA